MEVDSRAFWEVQQWLTIKIKIPLQIDRPVSRALQVSRVGLAWIPKAQGADDLARLP